ncbi:MAG: hypothetical protein PHE15_00105 [Dehalococcoidales bacterium]|nr:hypothetical protein [Dehalococcoidales bacterium]
MIKKKKRNEGVRDGTLDDLVRKYIRLISDGYCRRCGEHVGVEWIEVAHMYRRSRKTVRWDLRNVYPLCKDNPSTGRKGCHGIVDNDQLELTSFMYEVMTPKEISELQEVATMTLKEYPIDREKIKAELKEKTKELECVEDIR